VAKSNLLGVSLHFKEKLKILGERAKRASFTQIMEIGNISLSGNYVAKQYHSGAAPALGRPGIHLEP